MGRNRVLSFMSQLSGSYRDSRTSTPSPPPDGIVVSAPASPSTGHKRHATPTLTEPFPSVPAPNSPVRADYASSANSHSDTSPPNGSQNVNVRSSYSQPRRTSRPTSMIQTYQPHIMDINDDTIPELQPIFTFLNSHGNKLYQEGYFLKLDDQNTNGRPNADRNWIECFAQLVGTVLSLWDAAELDQAGEHGEVLPKFINLTDASIKMIDSLPTRSPNEQPLQNILSLSTAGRNRYLLHFNSHHSLIQWTSSIRLAMYEQSTLQEAYTGALIAGKGKSVNNIGVIMNRAHFKTEEWVRVRFGAGVPWRRCWCVITPPDEKEVQRMQKDLKKRSPYDRSHAPALKGDIKFYDVKVEGKKQKKARPIAALNDAYSAYAIYPQSKALVDASTLIKIEGTVSIYSDPPSATEGFVFIMPEVPPAVTGFEMLLRFLFPTWDTFGLYGRPGRLVASTLDSRSLMFGMPKHKRYGYLEVGDIAGLVLDDTSTTWSERDWRKKLKELTGQRMATVDDSPPSGLSSRHPSGRSQKRLSFGPSANGNAAERSLPQRAKVGFADDAVVNGRPRTDSAPAGPAKRQPLPSAMAQAVGGNAVHGRNFSDSTSTSQGPEGTPMQDLQAMQRRMEMPEPVIRPPAFNHTPSQRPTTTLYHSAEMRQANTRLSSSTLAQITGAGTTMNPGWAANIPENQPSMTPMQPGMAANVPPSMQQPRPPMQSGSNGPNGPSGPNNGPGPNFMAQQQGPPQRGPPPRGPQQAGLKINTTVPGSPGQMGSRPSPSLQSPMPNSSRTPSPYGRPGPQQFRGPPPPQHQQLPNGPPQRMRTPPPQNAGPGFLATQTSPPVLRKPLPPSNDAPRSTILVEADSNYGVGIIADYYLNEADSRPIQPAQELDSSRRPPIMAQGNMNNNRIDRGTTPDFASMHGSIHRQESLDRPRGGPMSPNQSRMPDFSIPEVNMGGGNFGPNPGNRRPGPRPGPGPNMGAPRPLPQPGMGGPLGRSGAMTPDSYDRRNGPNNGDQWVPPNRGNNAGNPALRRSASFNMINSAPIVIPAAQQQRPSSSGNGSGRSGPNGPGNGNPNMRGPMQMPMGGHKPQFMPPQQQQQQQQRGPPPNQGQFGPGRGPMSPMSPRGPQHGGPMPDGWPNGMQSLPPQQQFMRGGPPPPQHQQVPQNFGQGRYGPGPNAMGPGPARAGMPGRAF